MKAAEVYQMVANDIIEMLESGAVDGTREMPWHRITTWPTNFVTEKQYSGFNAFMLMMLGAGRPAKWATFKQWQAAGGKVKKGAKSARIMVPMSKTVEDKDGSEHTKTWYKPVPVFNFDQIEGLEDPDILPETDPRPKWMDAEIFIERTGAKTKFGNGCFYNFTRDEVAMIPLNMFKDSVSARAFPVYSGSYPAAVK